MGKLLQRIRGVIGIGLTWAVGWAPIGAVVGVVLHLVLPGSPIPAVVTRNAATFAVLGFVAGAIFAAVLRVTEAHHRFDELSLPRFAAWGAVGGGLLGGVAVAAGLWGAGVGPLGAGLIGAAILLGAGSAAGSLALARRGEDRELLKAGADVTGGGLTETERHHLLRKES